MAAPTVGYAVLPVVPSLKGVDAELRRQLNGPAEKAGKDAGQKAAKGFRDSFKELNIDAQSLTSFGTKAVAVGGVVAFGLTKAAQASASLSAALATNRQIFGEQADEIERWSKNSAEGFGLSQRAAVESANTFALFASAAGKSGAEATKFSTSMVELAADMAAARDTTPEDAITALGAAMRGEFNPIERYGVMLTETTLKAKATELGIYEGSAALTAQQKILAAHAVILEDTAYAQGQFARESDQLQTQQAKMTAEWENAQAALGQALVPMLTSAAGATTDLLRGFQELSPETQKTVSYLAAAGAAGTVLVGGLSLAAGAGMRLQDAWGRMSTAAANGNRVMAVTTRTAKLAGRAIGAAGLAFAAYEAAQALNQATKDTVAYDTALKRLSTIDASNVGAALADAAEESRGLFDDIVRIGEAIGFGGMGPGQWDIEVQGSVVQLSELEGRLQDLWKADPEGLATTLDVLGDSAQVDADPGALAELERIVGRFRENLDATSAAEKDAADGAGILNEELDAQQEAMDAASKATEALDRAIAGLTARQQLNTLAFDAGRVAAQSYLDAIDRSTDVDNLLRSGLGIGSAMRDLREGVLGVADASEAAETTTDSLSDALRDLDDALTATNPDLSVTSINLGRMSEAADGFRQSLVHSSRFASQIGAALDVGEAFRDWRKTFRRLPAEIDIVDAAMGKYRKRQTEAIRDTMALGESMREYLGTLIETGKGTDFVRAEADRMRAAFVAQMRQMGLNEDQIRKYIELMGLAPEQVETAFKVAGVDAARFEIEAYLQLLEGRIPESVAASVTAKIRAGDLEAAAKELADLAAKNPVRLDVDVSADGVEEAKRDLIDLPRHFDFAKAALGGYTEAQEKGLEAVLALGDATKEYLSEVLASRGPEAARTEADRLRESFRKQFEQLGITGEAFDEYADKLLGLDEVDVEASIALAGFDRTIFEIETLYALLTDLGALSDEEKILLSVAISKGDLDLARQILTNQIGNWNDTLAPVKVRLDASEIVGFRNTVLDPSFFGGGTLSFKIDADTSGAQQAVGEFKSAAGLEPIMTVLDADMTKAVEEHLRYISLVTGVFPEVPLDADDTQAVRGWLDYIRKVTGEDVPLPLDADDSELWRAYLDFVRGAEGTEVKIPLGWEWTANTVLDPRIFGGGRLPGFNTGGLIPGAGRGDKVPILAEPGEYVVSREGVQAVGVELLDRINEGRVDTLAGSTLTATVVDSERRAGFTIQNLTLVSPSAERSMEEIVTNGAVWAHAAGFGEN